MDKVLLSPPAAFLIVLAFILIAARLLSALSFRRDKETEGDIGESYACGEKNYDNRAYPDYSMFFPFAFFFTLAHVATLIMTTVPTEIGRTFLMAAAYIAVSALGLYILFRK